MYSNFTVFISTIISSEGETKRSGALKKYKYSQQLFETEYVPALNMPSAQCLAKLFPSAPTTLQCQPVSGSSRESRFEKLITVPFQR